MLINPDNSHTTQIGFSSNVTNMNNTNALPVPQTNIQAASSYIPCSQKGGKVNRKKINKISRKYKMSRTRKSHIKRRLTKRLKRTRSKSKSRRYRMKGGYAQYQNNMPMTNTYSLGSKLSASDSALANPPPVTRLSNCTNCIDNYNHNNLNAYGYRTGSGFPSKGWF
jgi:hypothetical protein